MHNAWCLQCLPLTSIRMFCFKLLSIVYFLKRIFSTENINSESSIVRTRFKTTIKDVKVVIIQAEKTSETSCWFRPMYLSVLPKWYTTNSGSSCFWKSQTADLFPTSGARQISSENTKTRITLKYKCLNLVV